MGTIREDIEPARLFFGLLARDEGLMQQACLQIDREYSPITVQSAILPFDFTRYYEREMGSGLLRQWVAVEKPIGPGELVEIKHRTNAIELLYLDAGGRSINIDPGYVTADKVVLATTKNYSHRLYLGRGIYGEATLKYRHGSGFEPWPWTYPDYRGAEAQAFFNLVRQAICPAKRTRGAS